MAVGTEDNDRNNTVSSQTLTSLPNLPLDLIEQILYRLPVKLLIQLRCLCKSFNSLISDPKFAKNHLRLSIKRHHLIVSSTNNSKYSILFDSPIVSVFSNSRVSQTQLNYPNCDNRYNLSTTMCSCDGIICFAIAHGSIVLWNPSIRKYKILPNLENTITFRSFSFGYDHFIDNYKIIVVSRYFDKTKTRVHTLGTDHWRKIQEFPHCGPILGFAIFVSDTVNWLVPGFIVSLDLEKESYQKLSKPNLEKSCSLGVLKDCLCIFASTDVFFDVWVMKEYGVEESWTKLYTIPYMEDQSLTCGYTKVLYITEDDQILLDFDNAFDFKLKLVVYDSKNATLKNPEILNIDGLMDPQVYIESLISPCL